MDSAFIHAQIAYIPEAVHGLSIAFTHKLRIFLRPYMDSALIHAQIAYIPEANKWTHMYNKKLIV